MSTNYRVSTPEEFFDIANNDRKDKSLLNQLAVSLKSSLKVVWNYLKNIDVKIKPSANKQAIPKEPKLMDLVCSGVQLAADNDKLPQKQGLQKTSNIIQRAMIPEGQSTQKKGTKKQRLQEKKQHKKVISFDDFLQQQQRKLNESYIRKNIEQKKTLNRSMPSQDNNLNSSVILGNNDVSHSALVKSASQLLKARHNDTILNDTILNISDIDSECNFNILNNSDLYERMQGDEGEEENGEMDFTKVNARKKLELKLSQYPFLMPGRKEQVGKGKNTHKSYFSLNINKIPLNKISSKSILDLDNSHQFIDVDNLKSPDQKLRGPVKRGLSSYAIQSQNKMRKRVKQSNQIEDFFEATSDQKSSEKNQKFDMMLQSRYEKMVEDMLGQKSEDISREQTLSLKEDYEKYIAKNFGAMQFAKKRLQSKQSQKSAQPAVPTQQKPKISQILKPLDLSPQIERKKLYNFTRECESKINICFQLEKSVREDKERQMAEEMRKRQEEEQRLKREEEEKRRKEEIEKKQVEQEMRRKIQQEQEAIKIAEQIKNQQEQQKVIPTPAAIEKPSTTEQCQQLKSSSHQSEQLALSKTPSESKPEEQPSKQSIKEPIEQSKKTPLSLFGAKTASLFKHQKTEETSLQVASKEDKQTLKQSQTGLFKKKSSVLEVKPASESQKKAEQGSKSPEIPSVSEKKQNPKEQNNEQKPAKYNPFLAAVTPKPPISKLQEIINSKKDDNSLFKTVITSTNPPNASPQRQAPQPALASFMSPVHTKHNTSHYSNLDSSMCEESESNITPNSQLLGNPSGGLNGSFLNNSFSSQQNSGLFPVTQSSTPTGSLFGGNAGSSLFGSAYNPMNSSGTLFGNATQPKPSASVGGLFGSSQPNMFMSNPINPIASNTVSEAVNKIPSFMQNHPSLAQGINPQNAMNLFNQRSPTKNQNQSLFAPPPSQTDKRTTNRREKKSRDERIR